jgi:hypothetical protein
LETFNELGIKETNNWLYCIKTSVPLLPVFKYDLANAFIKSPELYTEVLEVLKAKIGKLSDDGDSYVDKHSGWIICKIDFDVEEGYEDGFKISSRSIMEEDAGNKIMSMSNVSESKTVKYDTFETRTINNIINALSFARV